MVKFIFRRLFEAVPVLLIIATGTFFIVRLAPGGPFDREKAVTPEVEAALNAHYGLDAPLHVQYFRFLGNLLKGDLGPSFKYPGWTVNELILAKIPVSLELGLYALIIAVLLGVTAGVIASLKPNRWSDHLTMTIAMAGICLPTFVLGPVLVLVFALKLEWFNVSGWFLPTDRILPAFTLGIFYAAYVARLTRGSMLEVRNQDYIRTARAKGLPAWRVTLVHALRNGILPVVTFLGPAAAGVISGSFVVETIFHIPGLGRFFVNAAFNRDYTMVIGTVLFYATLLILLNLLVDILQSLLNPKIRLQ
jgi:oligopeptide transport system permease protein